MYVPADWSNFPFLQSKFIYPYSDYFSMSHTSIYSPPHPQISYVHTQSLPKQSQGKWFTYISLIIQTSCVFVPQFINSRLLHSLSYTRLIMCVKKVPFTAHSSIHPNVLMCIIRYPSKRFKAKIRFSTHSCFAI